MGTQAIAGEEDKRTMDLLLAQPIPRRKVVLESFLAMAIMTTGLAVAVWIVLLAFDPFVDLGLPFQGVLAANVGMVLLALVFGTLSLAIGAATGRRGLAISAGAGATLATFFINGLAPLVDAIAWTQRLTPFYWFLRCETPRAWVCLAVSCARSRHRHPGRGCSVGFRAPRRGRLTVTKPFPTIAAASVPWLTVDQMVEADRLAIEEFNIDLLQMMEHAGSSLSEVTQRLAPSGRITILAGAGNNGGGGLCAARHLINRGRDIEVVLVNDSLGAVAVHHLGTLSEMGIEPSAATSQASPQRSSMPWSATGYRERSEGGQPTSPAGLASATSFLSTVRRATDPTAA